MKSNGFSVKRRVVRKGPLKTLFANLPGKRHRAATAVAAAPELEGDVPNLGVARALMVILAIHVLAIAGIFVHSHFFEKQEMTGGETVKLLDTQRPPRAARDGGSLPTVREGDASHFVSGTESWQDIAAMHQVDEQELRQLNGDIRLRSGIRLVLPAKKIAAREPAEVLELGRERETPSSVPVATLPPAPVDRLREGSPMVSTLPDEEEPVLVRSRVERSGAQQTPPAREAVRTPGTGSPAVGRSYQVKKGDTVWAIAKKHGVTPAALMQANGIKDASKLRLGATLKIPAAR